MDLRAPDGRSERACAFSGEEAEQLLPEGFADFLDAARAAADLVATDREADVILVNAPMEPPVVHLLLDLLPRHRQHKNVVVILVTEGGYADVAYGVAKAFQRFYDKVHCFVPGYCKSAGTLAAVGAHELIMSDHGELGPVDVQLIKKDEVGEQESGEVLHSTLKVLISETFNAFNYFYLETKRRSGGSITFRTASDVAIKLAVGIMSPIAQQVDPTQMGVSYREMQVARSYAEILDAVSQNLKRCDCPYEDTCGELGLGRLLRGYPSHSFIIDREEATRVFQNVQAPSDYESQLALKLGPLAMDPSFGKIGHGLVRFLSSQNAADGTPADTPGGPAVTEESDDPLRSDRPPDDAPMGEQGPGDGKDRGGGIAAEGLPTAGATVEASGA